MRARDRFGFWFWLGWIFWFAASFILSSLLWTAALKLGFGEIAGGEMTLTWAIAVFGTWFLLVIPFMRKKEQIWKRLNADQEKAVDAWLAGMGLFIGLMIASCVFWDFLLKTRLSSSRGLDPVWSKSVFGTWLALLIPFLILMYRKADRLFREAAERQNPAPNRHRRIYVERGRRMLPGEICRKLKNIPPTLATGHVVNLVMKDGRSISHVFVINSTELLGIYDREGVDFDVREIADVEPVDLSQLPAYDEARWVRLDG